MLPEPRRLTCHCCDLPFARVENGKLLIRSHHHGKPHENSLTVEELQRLLEAMTRSRSPLDKPAHPSVR